MLTVDITTENDLLRALETLARTAAGLLLEDIDTRISTYDSED